ncbi:hypothetical protein B0J13DRAFT_680413 [Dactylonectria estremocensis]|uniref:NADH:flavin oxidoreductase/NADH oxidase N-terminal domain-containing protein n=1 Tax=Dactylonectria estremocensis TaxID=1079267 RepID=A0A9P9DMT9_9HYPO|nr:hypothetical protein B0J13DRAFT_680413 [Dactylonectria estremocensis]
MTRLFQPLVVGSSKLDHRVTMAPLTRYRCDDAWLPARMTKEYYKQRACVRGTLITTEATIISCAAASARNVPRIWCDAIFCQLWHQGRAGQLDVLEEGGFPLLSSIATLVSVHHPVPAAMSEEDIQQTIADFATAAKNAIAAGFDMVEVHGANGYLLDQFFIENRASFHVEVTKAIIAAVGADKTAMRLSPYSDFLGMLMNKPDPTFQYVMEQLKPLGLAHLHLIEARMRGNDDADCGGQRTIKWMVELWDHVSPVLIAGGFDGDSAKAAAGETYKGYDVAIVFGRYFVANPDLVFWIKSGIGLGAYERTYFYTRGCGRGMSTTRLARSLRVYG